MIEADSNHGDTDRMPLWQRLWWRFWGAWRRVMLVLVALVLVSVWTCPEPQELMKTFVESRMGTKGDSGLLQVLSGAWQLKRLDGQIGLSDYGLWVMLVDYSTTPPRRLAVGALGRVWVFD